MPPLKLKKGLDNKYKVKVTNIEPFCCSAHEKFVLHGRNGVRVSTDLMVPPERSELEFPHIEEEDFVTEDNITIAPHSLFGCRDGLLDYITNLDIDFTL